MKISDGTFSLCDTESVCIQKPCWAPVVAGGMLVRSILPEGGSGETNHHDIVCK